MYTAFLPRRLIICPPILTTSPLGWLIAGAAHIGAMYTAFLSVAMACGTPGLMAALALGALRATSFA